MAKDRRLIGAFGSFTTRRHETAAQPVRRLQELEDAFEVVEGAAEGEVRRRRDVAAAAGANAVRGRRRGRSCPLHV